VLVVPKVVEEGAVVFWNVAVAVALAVGREEFDVATTTFWWLPGQLKWAWVGVVDGAEEVEAGEEEVEDVVGVELELRMEVDNDDDDQIDVAGRVDVTKVLLEVAVTVLVDQALEVVGEEPSSEYTFKLVTFQ